jgi:hypothetical protein
MEPDPRAGGTGAGGTGLTRTAVDARRDASDLQRLAEEPGDQGLLAVVRGHLVDGRLPVTSFAA